MYTTIAYRATIAPAGVLTLCAPIADPHLTVGAFAVFTRSWCAQVLGAYAGAAGNLQAQLRSPSIRKIFNQEITPIQAAIVALNPVPWMDKFDHPMPLDIAEGLEMWFNDAGGALVHAGIVFLGDGPVTPVKGDIRTMLATTATAAVAGVWTNSALILPEVLPSGRYQLVGARFASTTALAARFVGVQPYARPGVLGSGLLIDVGLSRFREGNCGVMGEFQHDNPPTVDVLCNAADAAAVQLFALDLIYLGK